MYDDVTVKKLYYDVVKMYELPVRNHLHIAKKVKELEGEVGEFRAKHYLATLLKRDLRREDGEYKPVMADGLDPYIKRVKIEKYLTDNKAPAPAATAHMTFDEHEAKRRTQWDD